MRAIIDGTVYDTARATKVARYYRSSGNAPRHVLYTTESGIWFELVQTEIYEVLFRTGSITVLTADEAYQRLHDAQLIDPLKKYFPDRVNNA